MGDLGHALLRERLAESASQVLDMLRTFDPKSVELCPNLRRLLLSNEAQSGMRFVVTGTGSSEAHGRYLVHLINRFVSGSTHTDGVSRVYAAEFVPLSTFCLEGAANSNSANAVLVVISQGISANARIALKQRCHFRHCVLFTSTTDRTAAPPTAKGALLLALHEEARSSGRADVVLFPKEDEYVLLIRLIGPLAGYMRVLQFAQGVFGEISNITTAHFPTFSSDMLTEAWSRSERACQQLVQDMPFSDLIARGIQLIVPNDVIPYCQNLQFKFLEGLYTPFPPVWDPMSFAHGPFQQAERYSRDLQPFRLFLHGTCGSHSSLAERLRQMVPSLVQVASDLPAPYRIFEFEFILNRYIAQACESLQINQMDWPGKGLDGPLYLLDHVLFETPKE
eukprot:ANDGO_08555.mRNA.1 hypothetical protein